MAITLNARGTSENSFKVGKKGPQITNTNGFEFRNTTNTDYVEIHAAPPTTDNSLTTKSYVDSVATGLDIKESCIVSTVSNITLSGLQTIDGVLLSENDRVLVKDQTTQTENGIYNASSGSWSRSYDADNTPSNEVSGGLFTFIESGTANENMTYVLSSPNGNAVLGVDDLIFTVFSSSTNIVAGNGLEDTNGTFSVKGTAGRIVVDGDGVDIADTITAFKSTGITDNSTETVITVSADESVQMYRNHSDTSELLTLIQDHANSTGDVIAIGNDGTGDAIEIVNTGDARGLFINSSATTQPAISITTNSTGNAFETNGTIITNTGRIGIGNATITEHLNLNSTDTSRTATLCKNTVASTYHGVDSNGGIAGTITNNPYNIITNNTIVLTVGADGSLILGSPTGGSRGAGTINASNLYVNGDAVKTNNKKATTTKTSDYTTVINDEIIFVDTTSNIVEILLSGVSNTNGNIIIIKDVGGNARTNNITIGTVSSPTIDGENTVTINENYGVVYLISDGSNWFVLDSAEYVFDNGLIENHIDNGNSSSAKTIEVLTSNSHFITLTDDTTLTFNGTPPSNKTYNFVLWIQQDVTGGRTITWPASVKWSNQITPTISSNSNDVDVYAFTTFDSGTTWYGMISGQDFG